MAAADKLNGKFSNIDVADLNKGFGALFGTQPTPSPDAKGRVVIELPIRELHAFGFYDPERAQMHRFRPYSEEKMDEFVESVKMEGILTPLLVREYETNQYEILAGHNRKRGAELAGLETIPCIVLDADDEQAVIIMTRTNIDQRDGLLPSERAWGYRLELEARNRQGQRMDLTYSQNGNKLDSRNSSTVLAGSLGTSKTKIYRFMRLTYLVQELADKVDDGSLTLGAGESLSYLTQPTQESVNRLIESEELKVTPDIADALKARFREKDVAENELQDFLQPTKTTALKVAKPFSLKIPSEKIERFFPGKTKKEIEQTVIGLLEMHYS